MLAQFQQLQLPGMGLRKALLVLQVHQWLLPQLRMIRAWHAKPRLPLSHAQLHALQDGQTVQTIQGVQVPGLITNVEKLSLVAAKA